MDVTNPYSERVWALVSGFPGRHRTERQLLMLQAYIDESGHGEDTLVFAGYIAPARIWADEFTPQWADTLALGPPNHRRIEAFKMREMLWDSEHSSWFYRVIERTVTAEFSCVISTSDLYSAYREFPWPFRFVDADLFTNPYFYGFKALMSLLASHQHLLGLNEPIDFIVDASNEKDKCMVAWEGLKRYAPPEVQAMLGDPPIFRDDKTTLPLQAADLLAYWAREWHHQGVLGDLEKMNFPWDRKRKIPGAAFALTKDTFLNVFKETCSAESLDRIFKSATRNRVQHVFPAGSTIENMEEAQKKDGGLPIVNKDNVRPMYINAASTAFTQFDIRVALTEVVPNSSGGAENELRANIVTTPAHARALATLLASTVENYERNFGKVEHPNPVEKQAEDTKSV